jgi:Glycosyl hydrolase family 63 C-terminal domain
VLRLPNGENVPLKVRSLVGLVPLFAIMTLEPEIFEKLPNFARRCEWFIQNRPDLRDNVACMHKQGVGERRLLAIAYPDKLRQILKVMLDESEFFSPYGIRSVSKFHASHPYKFEVDSDSYQVNYEPAESTTDLFGGNSNWRGPIWFPLNYVLVEALFRFYNYFGDEFTVECPTGSGQWMNLREVAIELSQRLIRIFLQDEAGHRPVFGGIERFQTDPHWQDWILFHEYFNGDNGAGLGASHQTGWTGLVAYLMQRCQRLPVA